MSDSKPFPVRALARGFCGCLREVGDTFEIVDEQLGSWMQPVNAADAERLEARIAELGKRYPRQPKIGEKVPATTAQLKEIPKYKPRTDAAAPAKPADDL